MGNKNSLKKINNDGNKIDGGSNSSKGSDDSSSNFSICHFCGENIREERYNCLFCDVDSSSFDLCKKCKEIQNHPHQLTKIEQNEAKKFEYFDNCAEALYNRLQFFSEKRLFGVLKKRNEKGNHDEILCLEYLNSEEAKSINLENKIMKMIETDENGDEDYVKYIFFFEKIF
jgi:hypothetical protein